jgi:hypothetical protein
MIGKAEWFTYRKFGWGLSPKTWQGWLYVAVAALILGFITSLSAIDTEKMWIAGIFFAVFIADILHIMMQLPKVSDERENYHQLIIERNCSFAAIGALVGIALWQTYMNRRTLLATGGLPFDYTILIILGAMFVTKVVSSFYVNWKM